MILWQLDFPLSCIPTTKSAPSINLKSKKDMGPIKIEKDRRANRVPMQNSIRSGRLEIHQKRRIQRSTSFERAAQTWNWDYFCGFMVLPLTHGIWRLSKIIVLNFTRKCLNSAGTLVPAQILYRLQQWVTYTQGRPCWNHSSRSIFSITEFLPFLTLDEIILHYLPVINRLKVWLIVCYVAHKMFAWSKTPLNYTTSVFMRGFTWIDPKVCSIPALQVLSLQMGFLNRNMNKIFCLTMKTSWSLPPSVEASGYCRVQRVLTTSILLFPTQRIIGFTEMEITRISLSMLP